MRLDADLLARTPSYLNPLKDRELNLRGHKIPAIENLGVTRDQIDSIDLTDNSISTLSNFPLLRRLQHVLLANNPVRTISPSVPTSLPNLRTLILTNAAFPKESLANLGDVLGNCKRLETLSLKGCPVQEAQHYKEWIIFKCKKLRCLDYERVKEKDREQARSLFVNAKGDLTSLSQSFSTHSAKTASAAAKTFEPGVEPSAADFNNNAPSGKAGRLLSKEEKERIRSAIEGASSVDEIRRLQRMLAQGFVPTEKDLRDFARKKKVDGVTKPTNGEEVMEE